jgi:dihydropteroate synthase
LRIIRWLKSFESLGLPLLIGLSRKSFIGATLNAEVDKRLIGTVTANVMAVLNGADIIRVHDVKPAVDMVRMINAVRAAQR